ncbi:IS66 family transposase [Sorangium sp. So ce1128]
MLAALGDAAPKGTEPAPAPCEEAAAPEPGDGSVPQPPDPPKPRPGLLAHILVDKYHDSTPLYRQTQQYERSAVSLSPSTLGDWATFGIDVLTPVADRIFERVVGAFYLHVRCRTSRRSTGSRPPAKLKG